MNIKGRIDINSKIEAGETRGYKPVNRDVGRVEDKVSLEAGNNEIPSKSEMINQFRGKPVVEKTSAGENVKTPSADVKSSSLSSPGTISGKEDSVESNALYFNLASAGSSTPGSVNAGVLGSLTNLFSSKTPVFYRKRKFRIPLVMGKYGKITKDEAENILRDGSSIERGSLGVKTPDSSEVMPMIDQQDLREIQAFYHSESVNGLPDNDMAGILRSATEQGLKLRTSDGKTVGAYGAYNLLTTGWVNEGITTEGIDIIKDGVHLMSISPDNLQDTGKISHDLTASLEAYKEMKPSKNFFSVLKKSAGKLSFAERTAIFNKLRSVDMITSNPMKVYDAVLAETKEGESFDDNAEYYASLKENYAWRCHGSSLIKVFCYAKRNLQNNPDREKVFGEILREAEKPDIAIKALELLDTPIADESYDDRKGAMIELLKADAAEGIKGYETVSQCRWENESFVDACYEYAKNLRLVDGNKRGDVRKAYLYTRTDMKDDQWKATKFLKMFRGYKDFSYTKKKMQELKQRAPGNEYDDYIGVMSDILIYFAPKESEEAFDKLVEYSQQGNRFKEIGEMYVGFMNSMGGRENIHKHAGKALDYAVANLKEKPEKLKVFSDILNRSADVDDAAKYLDLIEKPLKKESYADRAKAVTILARYDNCIENYRELDRFTQPGETIADVAEQFETIHTNLKGYVRNTDPAMAKFLQLKSDRRNDPEGLKRFLHLFKAIKDYDTTEKALKLLEKPVKKESYKERMSILFKMEFLTVEVKSEDAFDTYNLISTRLDKSETLKEANNRLELLANAFKLPKTHKDVREAFKFIADRVENDKTGKTTTKDLMAKMLSGAMLTEDINKAKEYIEMQETGEGKENSGKNNDENIIKSEEEYVEIGGVRVKKGK